MFVNKEICCHKYPKKNYRIKFSLLFPTCLYGIILITFNDIYKIIVINLPFLKDQEGQKETLRFINTLSIISQTVFIIIIIIIFMTSHIKNHTKWIENYITKQVNADQNTGKKKLDVKTISYLQSWTFIVIKKQYLNANLSKVYK